LPTSVSVFASQCFSRSIPWIPPGEKHWRGASPTNGMAHIAMQEVRDGTHVTWMEHVSDEQYGGNVE
jgi:hypothetical protein